jgi:hypothetical protein
MSRPETASAAPSAAPAGAPRRAELERQRDILRTAIADLSGRLEAVERELSVPEPEPPPPSVVDTLTTYAAALAERAAVAASAASAARDRLRSSLAADPRTSGLLAEYEQFETAMRPALANLPEGYRSALLAHHETVTRQLSARVAAAARAPVPLDAEPLLIEVVYAIDAPDGPPELLVAVVPVHEGVAQGDGDKPEGLCTWVAARVVQGLYEALAASGLPGAEVASGGHQGLLALEVDVQGASDDLPTLVEERLSVALSGAGEVSAARVEVALRRIDIDTLIPPEEDGDA